MNKILIDKFLYLLYINIDKQTEDHYLTILSVFLMQNKDTTAKVHCETMLNCHI